MPVEVRCLPAHVLKNGSRIWHACTEVYVQPEATGTVSRTWRSYVRLGPDYRRI